jgi:predicted nucleic acid-binding protein
VLVKWFRREDERHLAQADALRAAFEAGDLSIVAQSLVRLEIMNAARRGRWDEVALVALASALEALEVDALEPDLQRVAFWMARGLTAYDASYVAVAESEALPLVTDDDEIVAVAAEIAIALGSDDIIRELQRQQRGPTT